MNARTARRREPATFDRTHLRANAPLREAIVHVPSRPDYEIVPVLQVNALGGLLVDFGGEGEGAVRWIPSDWEVKA